MANLADLVVRITAQTKEFDKAIQQTKKKTEGVESGIAKTTSTIKNLVTGVGVAVLVTKIGEVASASIELASEAEETRAKFNTAFKGIEEDASAVAENLAKNYGLARSESEQLLAGTGDLIKGFGATATEALNISGKVQALSVDLASYNNLQGGASRASDILTKAFLGERDALTSLGIKISEADVKQRLLEKGQENLTGQSLLLAKGQATLELATKQSDDAIGDFARTSESYANVTRRAEAATKDLQVELGRSLLPTSTVVKGLFGDIVGEIAAYVRGLNDLRDAQKAVDEGRATLEQSLLLVTKRIEEQDKLVNKLKEQADFDREEFGRVTERTKEDLSNAKQKLDILERQRGNVQRQINEEGALKDQQQERADAENEQARKDEEAQRLKQENYKATLTLLGQIIDASKSDIQIIDEQIQSLTELQTKTEEDNTKRLEAIEALQAKKAEIIDEEQIRQIEANEKTLQAQIDLNDALYEEEKANQERIRAERQQTLNYSIDIANSLVALAGNVGQREIQTLEATAQARINALDQRLLGDEEYARQKEAIEKDLALKAYEIQLKQFQAEKALAIIQAGINTAVAVTALLATPPLAIAAGVSGAAQVAVIASQPDPPRPELATGATVKGTANGTPVTVAENFNNELILGDGQQGKPLLRSFAKEIVSEMGGSSRTMTKQSIIVQIDKQTIFDIMNEGIDSQEVRITTDNIQGGI